MAADQREFYRSPNGDAWFLARDPADQRAFIIQEQNKDSGGRSARIEIGAFLRQGAEGPEHQNLLRLIGTLVFRGVINDDVPSLPRAVHYEEGRAAGRVLPCGWSEGADPMRARRANRRRRA